MYRRTHWNNYGKKQIEKQQTLLVKMAAAPEDYSKEVDKIYALQREQGEAMAANVNYKAGKERIQEMIEYLSSHSRNGSLSTMNSWCVSG